MGAYLERRLNEHKIIVLNISEGRVSGVFDSMSEACEWCERLREKSPYQRFEVYEKVEHDQTD